MNSWSTAIKIVDSNDCHFGCISGEGFDTLVKVSNSSNISFKDIRHERVSRSCKHTILYTSIIDILKTNLNFNNTSG